MASEQRYTGLQEIMNLLIQRIMLTVFDTERIGLSKIGITKMLDKPLDPH